MPVLSILCFCAGPQKIWRPTLKAARKKLIALFGLPFCLHLFLPGTFMPFSMRSKICTAMSKESKQTFTINRSFQGFQCHICFHICHERLKQICAEVYAISPYYYPFDLTFTASQHLPIPPFTLSIYIMRFWCQHILWNVYMYVFWAKGCFPGPY